MRVMADSKGEALFERNRRVEMDVGKEKQEDRLDEGGYCFMDRSFVHADLGFLV